LLVVLEEVQPLDLELVVVAVGQTTPYLALILGMVELVEMVASAAAVVAAAQSGPHLVPQEILELAELAVMDMRW